MDELNRRWASGRFEMGVVYGARRIGKTVLLQEFVKNKNAFYFQARKENEKGNLDIFSREFRQFMGEKDRAVYSSFDDAFDAVARYAKEQRIIFIIDEISYLCTKGKALLSTLQYYIDHRFREENMMLILSGSNVSFMMELLNNREDPLYQRATFQIHLEKMPYSEARAFVRDLPVDDQMNYLALFGPHPFYLEMIDNGVSFLENVRRLLYTKYGTLADAPEKVMPAGTLFSNIYHSILKAIALGKRTNKTISEAIGEQPNYVSTYLATLLDTQLIERRESFIRNKKTSYYVIADHLLRFWYRFIFEKQEMIQLNMGDSFFREDQLGIRDFLARNFEDVALLWMTEQNRQGKLPCLYQPFRNYVVEGSKLGRSIELDGLAEGYGSNAHRLLVVECKYRSIPFNLAMLAHLQESVSIFDHYPVIDYYLFSRNGFSEEISGLKDPQIHLITPEMMCSDENMVH